MRKLLTSAHRHWRMRSAAALATVGALILTTGGVLISSAAAEPGGNNGTLKVLNASSGVEFRNNEPKVCTFRFEGFGFDAGQSGELILGGQGQTTYSHSFGSMTADATGYFVTGNHTLANGHYKIEFVEPEVDADKFKSKVFKVNCGQPTPLREPVTDTSSDCVNGHGTRTGYVVKEFVWDPTADAGDGAWVLEPATAWTTEWGEWAYAAYNAEEYARLCQTPPPPPPPVVLEELVPAVTFTDPTCESLDGAGWDGTHESVLDYGVTGEVGPGETITVEATIESGLTDEYEFADNAQTEFTHTFADITLEDCVQGEETVIPKPDKPEPKPDKAPTAKGVEAVAPPAAAPTAVAAGQAGDAGEATAQQLGQGLAGLGVLMLVAAGWLGVPRLGRGVHQS